MFFRLGSIEVIRKDNFVISILPHFTALLVLFWALCLNFSALNRQLSC